MDAFSFSRLQTRLFLLILLAILPVLGLMLYSDFEQRRLAAAQAQDDALRLVQLAASEQAQLVQGARQLLIALAQLPAVRASDAKACSELFSKLLKRYYTEEIMSKEVEYIDYMGQLGSMCIFWSVYDWDAPQYQPTEEHHFIARFGEDSPYRSHKFYGAEDKETFSRTRSEMLKELPTPRRYVGKIYGPKGAEVHQCWHVGGLWSPNVAERWEDYWGDVVHTL